MSPLEDRVRQLEAEISLLRRELAASNQRSASVEIRIRGWFLGILNGSLAWDGTATAEIVVYDGSNWIKTGQTETVRGFWLNTDEGPVPANTLLRFDWYDNVWAPISIYCRANNWSW